MNKISLVTICDKNYLFHFETFFKSFILNEINPNVFLEHFFIYDDPKEIDSFNEKYCVLKEFEKIKINFIKYDSSYSDTIKTFAAHYRFQALSSVIKKKLYNQLLYVDIDSYINKSVYEICNEIKQSFGVFLRINKKNSTITSKLTNREVISKNINYKRNKSSGIKSSSVLSGTIFVKSNKFGKRILKKIINLFKESNDKYWDLDQFVLEEIFEYFYNIIDIYILPNSFLDLYCKKDTNLHFCKGITHSYNRSVWTDLVEITKIKFDEYYKCLKTIVIYEDRISDNLINKVLLNVHTGLKKKYKSYDIKFVNYCEFELIKCKYAITFNIYSKTKKSTLYRKNVKDFQNKNGNKLIIIELGFLNRENYFSIGYDNISNFGYYPEYPLNNDRLEKLNLNLKKINYDDDPNKYILFCTQVPWDTQLQDVEYTKWIIDTISLIKKHSKRKILVRTHPKHRKRAKFNVFDKNFFEKNKLDINLSDSTLADDLSNSYCVVAYNSTVLVDAIINGIPVLAGSESSIISNICIKDFTLIDKLPKITDEDIKKCLSIVAYKQWNLEEILEGMPFKYYI